MTLIHTVHTLPIFLGGERRGCWLYLSILNTSVPRLTGVTKTHRVLFISPLCGWDVFDSRDIKNTTEIARKTTHLSKGSGACYYTI